MGKSQLKSYWNGVSQCVDLVVGVLTHLEKLESSDKKITDYLLELEAKATLKITSTSPLTEALGVQLNMESKSGEQFDTAYWKGVKDTLIFIRNYINKTGKTTLSALEPVLLKAKARALEKIGEQERSLLEEELESDVHPSPSESVVKQESVIPETKAPISQAANETASWKREEHVSPVVPESMPKDDQTHPIPYSTEEEPLKKPSETVAIPDRSTSEEAAVEPPVSEEVAPSPLVTMQEDTVSPRVTPSPQPSIPETAPMQKEDSAAIEKEDETVLLEKEEPQPQLTTPSVTDVQSSATEQPSANLATDSAKVELDLTEVSSLIEEEFNEENEVIESTTPSTVSTPSTSPTAMPSPSVTPPPTSLVNELLKEEKKTVPASLSETSDEAKDEEDYLLSSTLKEALKMLKEED